jgi:hypothetical protein
MPMKITLWMSEVKKEHKTRITESWPLQIALLKSIRENEEKVSEYQLEIQYLASQIDRRLWELYRERSQPLSRASKAAIEFRKSSVEIDTTYNLLRSNRAALVRKLTEAQHKVAKEEIELSLHKDNLDWLEQMARVNKAGEAITMLEVLIEE